MDFYVTRLTLSEPLIFPQSKIVELNLKKQTSGLLGGNYAKK